MIGQCGKCGGWHTNPHSCPNTMSNHEASAPLADWRDAEIDRLRRELAEARDDAALLNEGLADAQEELSKCQQDACALQDKVDELRKALAEEMSDEINVKLAEARELLREARGGMREVLWCALVWNDHNFDYKHLLDHLAAARKAMGLDDFQTGIDKANAYMDRIDAFLAAIGRADSAPRSTAATP